MSRLEILSWTTALQWALWALVMVQVKGWVGRSRLRGRRASDAPTLVHPPSTLIVGLVCFGFFAGIAVASNVFRNKTTTWWTTTVFVGFALLSAAMVIAYFIAKHEVSADVGTTKYLRWSDLRAVRYAPLVKWFRLETHSGDVARISVLLTGLPDFARLLLAHAPGGAVDPDTLRVLQATAEGNPPSVWV